MRPVATAALVGCSLLVTAAPIRVIDVGVGAALLHTPDSYRGILVGNSVLVSGESGSILIDTGIPERSGQLRALIASMDVAPVRGIINTHPHLDHAGGNEAFADEAVLLVDESPSPTSGLPAVVSKRLPVLHSSEDRLVYLPDANVLVTGDVYPGGGYPALAVDDGASLDALLDALEWALARADGETVVVPGHGVPETREDLLAFREMVSIAANRIRALVADGLSVDEVVARKPTSELDAKWGGGFLSPDAWVEQLYHMVADAH